MTIIERMRRDWDQRAREDAYFYAGFAHRNQSDADFFASAPDTVCTLENELVRLPPSAHRRALEIGCGPGRLMGAMAPHFGEIHGVDISEEMAALARQRLKAFPHAHVHVTPDSSLSMFPEGHFDFIYSYTVFQHIPSRDVVLGYLREAQRVLKPGGILCAQVRGTPPMQTELQREPETWTGCYFSGDEMYAFSTSHGFPLVAVWGLETQYMWTVWRKPASDQPPDFSRVHVKDVTISSGSSHTVPQRGFDAVVSLWIEGMPQDAGLSDLRIMFGTVETRGCYLSPVTEDGGAQLNARVPLECGTGPVQVKLDKSPATYSIEIVPFDMRPALVDVTDAIHIGSKYRIETGGMKVTLEGIERPSQVSFHLKGRQAEIVQIEFKDPVTLKYEYSFYLPNRTPKGNLRMIIRISETEMPVDIQIV
jgi:SAM-dependent methyltransferase